MGGRVELAVEMRSAYIILVGNLKARDCLEDQSVGGRIIFKMDFREIGCEGMD
jgi:hypothetical protein